MGKMYFPGEKPEKKVEKLIDRVDGSLSLKYQNEVGETVEDHHKGNREDSPLVSRDTYKKDRTNRETIYFKGDTGKEKPYLRRVYKDNALEIEQGLRGSLDKPTYEERYIYRYDELGHPTGTPSTTISTKYDEEGNELSLTITDKGKGVTKHVEYQPQKSSTLRDTLKKGQQNNMRAIRSRTQQRINERSIR